VLGDRCAEGAERGLADLLAELVEAVSHGPPVVDRNANGCGETSAGA
jgi:hypothetical protein